MLNEKPVRLALVLMLSVEENFLCVRPMPYNALSHRTVFSCYLPSTGVMQKEEGAHLYSIFPIAFLISVYPSMCRVVVTAFFENKDELINQIMILN